MKGEVKRQTPFERFRKFFCRGKSKRQGYNGAVSMGGEFNSVQAIVRRTYPKAIYVHCAAHSLNLVS
ncbi:hypothetical protein PGB90_001049 [Kerria lacca]